jgi:hypothetical protein
MRILALILPLAALPASGCNRDQAVPSAADNQAMDAASNQLDAAAQELDRVDQRLPVGNDMQPLADGNGS